MWGDSNFTADMDDVVLCCVIHF